MSDNDTRDRRGVLLMVGVVIVLLLPLGHGAVSSFRSQESSGTTPFLERPEAQYENCVRETVYMRFHHWELLREIRREVVRYGVRGDVGLAKCRDCHTSRERFCDRCHGAASVVVDCFGCHYYP